MNRPLFGAVLAQRLFGDLGDANGMDDPSLDYDGVGGTGVSAAPAQAGGPSRRTDGVRLGKAPGREFFKR